MILDRKFEKGFTMPLTNKQKGVRYHHGSPSSALGFTLTFYPSILMFLCLIGRLIWGFV